MDIVVHSAGPIATATISGEADADNCHLLGATLLDVSPETSSLQMDLSALTFLDSSAVGELLRIHGALGQRGVDAIISDASAAVTRVLEITGLLEIFGLPTH